MMLRQGQSYHRVRVMC